ncbi:hypothetical protein C445_11611 [Halobiforma lacisalsi AJ5]|uniref:Uncharacterized protein n=1 Tax=Natronobacterium lacisalsi AJ5 TaxID=358396 RepID=M0LIW5_NATLA|nr:hypothetical protein C445_11611 [Halobiforma lacisalsi AJ5]
MSQKEGNQTRVIGRDIDVLSGVLVITITTFTKPIQSQQEPLLPKKETRFMLVMRSEFMTLVHPQMIGDS